MVLQLGKQNCPRKVLMVLLQIQEGPMHMSLVRYQIEFKIWPQIEFKIRPQPFSAQTVSGQFLLARTLLARTLLAQTDCYVCWFESLAPFVDGNSKYGTFILASVGYLT